MPVDRSEQEMLTLNRTVGVENPCGGGIVCLNHASNGEQGVVVRTALVLCRARRPIVAMCS